MVFLLRFLELFPDGRSIVRLSLRGCDFLAVFVEEWNWLCVWPVRVYRCVCRGVLYAYIVLLRLWIAQPAHHLILSIELHRAVASLLQFLND